MWVSSNRASIISAQTRSRLSRIWRQRWVDQVHHTQDQHAIGGAADHLAVEVVRGCDNRDGIRQAIHPLVNEVFQRARATGHGQLPLCYMAQTRFAVLAKHAYDRVLLGQAQDLAQNVFGQRRQRRCSIAHSELVAWKDPRDPPIYDSSGALVPNVRRRTCP